MKEHAIIPIFIPHNGCQHDCVFCNQRRITARQKAPTPEEIEAIIKRNLSTIEEQGINEAEVAYFGGSFTGLSIDEQNTLLAPAIKYKEGGRILRIRLSTRPDYISDEIIENLLAKSVDVVELGAQSFDDEVLRISARGHTAEDTVRSLKSLKAAGFETALQLMSGLPGSTSAKDIASATTAAELMPNAARIYPTVILKDTELHNMYLAKEYIPPTQSEMLDTVKKMYIILNDAGINILRVGLKSTDLITGNSDSVSGSYHPAFRQLVEGSIAKDIIEEKLIKEIKENQVELSSNEIKENKQDERSSHEIKENQVGESEQQSSFIAYITANPSDISNAAGHNGENRKYFSEKYPKISIKYIRDTSIKKGEYRVKLEVDNICLKNHTKYGKGFANE